MAIPLACGMLQWLIQAYSPEMTTMKTFALYHSKPGQHGEAEVEQIDENTDLEELKQEGERFCEYRGLEDLYWKEGPNDPERWEIDLGDGELLVIRVKPT